MKLEEDVCDPINAKASLKGMSTMELAERMKAEQRAAQVSDQYIQ